MSLVHKLKYLPLALLAPLAAHATVPNSTFQFYFEGPVFDETVSAPNYVSGDLSLTVRAYTSDNKQALVDRRWDGLGVVTNSILDAGEVNSSLFNSPGDYLVLSFNKTVSLSTLRFSMWENDYLLNTLDHATVKYGSTTVSLSNGNDNGLLIKSFNLPNAVGSTFVIQATGALTAFRLAGVNATAAVPEPATYALMGLGLAGVALASRRRRQV